MIPFRFVAGVVPYSCGVLVGLALHACAGVDDGDTAADAGADAAADAVGDALADVGRDVGGDAVPDAAPDAVDDVTSDASDAGDLADTTDTSPGDAAADVDGDGTGSADPFCAHPLVVEASAFGVLGTEPLRVAFDTTGAPALLSLGMWSPGATDRWDCLFSAAEGPEAVVALDIPHDGYVTASTVGLAGHDTILWVSRGSCDGSAWWGEPIACHDSVNHFAGAMQSTVEFPAFGGERVYLIVDGSLGSWGAGQVELSLRSVPSEGEACAAASPACFTALTCDDGVCAGTMPEIRSVDASFERVEPVGYFGTASDSLVVTVRGADAGRDIRKLLVAVVDGEGTTHQKVYRWGVDLPLEYPATDVPGEFVATLPFASNADEWVFGVHGGTVSLIDLGGNRVDEVPFTLRPLADVDGACGELSTEPLCRAGLLCIEGNCLDAAPSIDTLRVWVDPFESDWHWTVEVSGTAPGGDVSRLVLGIGDASAPGGYRADAWGRIRAIRHEGTTFVVTGTLAFMGEAEWGVAVQTDSDARSDWVPLAVPALIDSGAACTEGDVDAQCVWGAACVGGRCTSEGPMITNASAAVEFGGLRVSLEGNTATSPMVSGFVDLRFTLLGGVEHTVSVGPLGHWGQPPVTEADGEFAARITIPWSLASMAGVTSGEVRVRDGRGLPSPWTAVAFVPMRYAGDPCDEAGVADHCLAGFRCMDGECAPDVAEPCGPVPTVVVAAAELAEGLVEVDLSSFEVPFDDPGPHRDTIGVTCRDPDFFVPTGPEAAVAVTAGTAGVIVVSGYDVDRYVGVRRAVCIDDSLEVACQAPPRRTTELAIEVDAGEQIFVVVDNLWRGERPTTITLRLDAVAREGEACGEGVARCAAPSRCLPTAAGDRCVVTRGLGDACSIPEQCGHELDCVAGICSPPATAPGGSCADVIDLNVHGVEHTGYIELAGEWIDGNDDIANRCVAEGIELLIRWRSDVVGMVCVQALGGTDDDEGWLAHFHGLGNACGTWPAFCPDPGAYTCFGSEAVGTEYNFLLEHRTGFRSLDGSPARLPYRFRVIRDR